ncbi:MAG: toll/interleukin-1 receptor domain-containing protein [Ferruginibacter sp.]
MALFTKAIFKSISTSRAGNKGIAKVLNEAKFETRSSKTTSLFLSHSHTDKDIVQEAVSFFKGFNHSIYIDWMDDTMPENTSGITAANIKNKIIENDMFILLATNKAVESKWCNWELGIADVFKFAKDKMVILPLADNSTGWVGNEYLQVYPRVELVNKDKTAFHDNIFYIIYPDGSRKWLDEWLKII